MRVLIVGSSGGTGRELVAQALERGHVVTAMARHLPIRPVDHPNLRIVLGDVLDMTVVEAAVQEQDAVLSALGHKRWFYPTRILSQGTINVIRAMETHGVRRLVCETSLGVGDTWWRMGLYYTLFVIPVILPLYFWDKHRQESAIRASSLKWVIVRPGALTNGPPRGVYSHGSRVGNLLWTVRISRADVAAFMLNQLSDDTYLGRATSVAW